MRNFANEKEEWVYRAAEAMAVQLLFYNGDEPSREIDLVIEKLFGKGSTGEDAPRYTESVDAAIKLVQHLLPDTPWRVVPETTVEDLEWCIPDFHDPVHGERLRAGLPYFCVVDPQFFLVVDPEISFSSNPAIALIQGALCIMQQLKVP